MMLPARGEERQQQDGGPEELGRPARPAAQRDARLQAHEQGSGDRDQHQQQTGDEQARRFAEAEGLDDAAGAEVGRLVDTGAWLNHAEGGLLPGGQPAHPRAGGVRELEDPAGGQRHQQRQQAGGDEPRADEHRRLRGAVPRADAAPQQCDRHQADGREQAHDDAEQGDRPRPVARADLRTTVQGVDHAAQRRQQSGEERGQPVHRSPPLRSRPSGACGRHQHPLSHHRRWTAPVVSRRPARSACPASARVRSSSASTERTTCRMPSAPASPSP
jgi:hypothetical protein